MILKNILEQLRSSNLFVAGSLVFAGGLGWASATAYLKLQIEEGVKTSAYLQAELKSLDAKTRVPGPKGDPGPAVYLPAGAIVAFDKSSECPTGWIAYGPAQGGLIVGAKLESGQHYADVYKYSDLPNYSEYPTGISQKPPPAKGKTIGKEYAYDPSTGKGNTYEFRNFSPDDPPGSNNQAGSVGYIALLYCKKLPE